MQLVTNRRKHYEFTNIPFKQMEYIKMEYSNQIKYFKGF